VKINLEIIFKYFYSACDNFFHGTLLNRNILFHGIKAGIFMSQLIVKYFNIMIDIDWYDIGYVQDDKLFNIAIYILKKLINTIVALNHKVLREHKRFDLFFNSSTCVLPCRRD
jgi:hypothetical protein